MFALCFIGVCVVDGRLIKCPGLFVFLIMAGIENMIGRAGGENQREIIPTVF